MTLVSKPAIVVVFLFESPVKQKSIAASRSKRTDSHVTTVFSFIIENKIIEVKLLFQLECFEMRFILVLVACFFSFVCVLKYKYDVTMTY